MAGLDPGSPDQAGTLWACLLPLGEAPQRTGRAQGWEAQVPQMTAARPRQLPGVVILVPPLAPPPAYCLLYLIWFREETHKLFSVNFCQQAGGARRGGRVRGKTDVAEGAPVVLGCPLASTGGAQASGPYIPTVAPTVLRYSHLSCPSPPRKGAKTELRPRHRGDPGLRSTPPFRKRKASEVGLVSQVSPNLSGQELALGSAWTVQPGISDLWALRDPW